MKWLALLVGAAVLAFTLFLLPRRAETPVVAPAPAPAAGAASNPSDVPPPPARSSSVSAAPERPQGIALHGVLYRGPGSDESHALLSVAASPAGMFRRGQAVAEGWSLQSIEQDHVTLSRGAAVARLDIVDVPRPAASASAAPAPAAVASEERLPGFVAGAPPTGAINVEGASERNRAFLEGRQRRLAASAARR